MSERSAQEKSQAARANEWQVTASRQQAPRGHDPLIKTGGGGRGGLPSLRSWRRFSWHEKSSFTLMLTTKVATFPGCRGNWARVSSRFQLKKSPYSFSTMTVAVVTGMAEPRQHVIYQSARKTLMQPQEQRKRQTI